MTSALRGHYGLMFLAFGPLGIITGQWLYRLAPEPKLASGYAFPAYLMGYGSLSVGTLLVGHQRPLLALVLLFDAVLMERARILCLERGLFLLILCNTQELY